MPEIMYLEDMRVYHGSDQIVDKPRIIDPTRNMDFGKGFYTTESEKQAETWAIKTRDRRESKKAYVSVYDFRSIDDLKILFFDEPTEEWFDFIHSNRIHGVEHDYDVIVGPVADDGVIMTLFKYDNLMLNKTDAIQELKTAKYQGQVLFHTNKSLGSIKFIEYREVER